MRIRKLVAAGLLAGSFLFVVAHARARVRTRARSRARSSPSASRRRSRTPRPSGPKGNYSTFNNDVDNCQKAKSLVAPAGPEIIWGGARVR